jgi:tetratricopeptide (TPR) repeat protein
MTQSTPRGSTITSIFKMISVRWWRGLICVCGTSMLSLWVLILTLPSAATELQASQLRSVSQPQLESAGLSPAELFKLASPSVYVVEVLDQSGAVASLGSAVAISTEWLATNKHVVTTEAVGRDEKDDRLIRIRQGDQTWKAGGDYICDFDEKTPHDVCLLHVPGVHARPLSLRFSPTLSVGEHVYAIGAPEGLAVTLSDGLVSGIRDMKSARVIQTTAPISPGSSGGGLFDSQGRLIGITTFFLEEGQNLNFALPAEWILPLLRGDMQTCKIIGGFAQDESGSMFARSIDLDGHRWFELGDESSRLKCYSEASFAFHRAVELNPADAWNWIFLGQTMKDWADSLPGLVKRADILAYEVDSLLRNLRIQQAIDAYQQALRLKRSDGTALRDYEISSIWYDIGDSYLRLSRFDEAIIAFKSAIETGPWDERELMGLALAYQKSHEGDKAAAVYARVLSAFPCYTDASFGLAYAYESQGQHSMSSDIFRRQVECIKSNNDARGSLLEQGMVFEASANYNDAIKKFEETIRLVPGDDVANYHLGEAYALKGDFGQASKVLDQLRGQYAEELLRCLYIAPHDGTPCF